MEPNKSSINFLLADAKEPTQPTDTPPVAHEPSMPARQDEDEMVVVVPRTTSSKQKKRHIHRPKNPRISLEIIQQPKNAKVSTRASGRIFPPFSEHRPIHPPPVLQLKVEDFKPKHEGALTDDLIRNIKSSQGNKPSERVQELEVIKKMRENRIPPWVHYSTFFVTAQLCSSQSQSEKLLFHNDHTQSVDDLLIGTNVASGMPLSLRINSSSSNKQLNHLLPIEKHKATNYGVVFVFPDLSVRKVGTFKLKFDLFEVYKDKVYWRNEVYSDDILIYTPKKFPGSTPSSPLTSFLYRRGARIRQRKRAPSKRHHNEDADDDEEEEEEELPDLNMESGPGNFPTSSSQHKYQRTQCSQTPNIAPVYSRSATSSTASTPYQQHQPFNVQPLPQIPVLYPHYQHQHQHPQALYIPYPPPQSQVVHHPQYHPQTPVMMYTQQPTPYQYQLPPPPPGHAYRQMVLPPYSFLQQHSSSRPVNPHDQPHPSTGGARPGKQ